MITYICGKPGGGKSISAIREIVTEMENPNGRYIVTNLPLVLSEWWERFGIEACEKRIRILGDEDIAQFYLHRIGSSGPYDLPIVTLAGLAYEVPDLSFSALDTSCNRGILYVIDEVHIHFHARQWQRVGMATQFWATQHRKVNDRVLLLTQKIEQVEKQVRNLGQEYWLCTNLSTQKAALSWVSHSRRVKVLKYLNASGTDKQPDGFEFDPAPFFGLYDTSGGVGVQGRGHGETDGVKKGVNIRLVVVGALVLLVVLAVGGWRLLMYTGKTAIDMLPTTTTIAEKLTGDSSASVALPSAVETPAGQTSLKDYVVGELGSPEVQSQPVMVARVLNPREMQIQRLIIEQQAELQRHRNSLNRGMSERGQSSIIVEKPVEQAIDLKNESPEN